MRAVAAPISNFQLPKLLRESLGEEKAESVVTNIEQKVQEEFDLKKDDLATKKDIADLSDKLTEKMNSQFKWLIALFISQMGFVFGIVYFILSFKK